MSRLSFSVRTWFWGVILAMVVLVLVFAGIGATLLGRTTRASDTLSQHLSPARTALARLEGSLIDEETGVRGFLLTRDEQFLAPFAQGESEEDAALASLRSLLADHPAALADIGAVERSATQWKAGFAAPAIAGVRAGKVVSQQQIALGKADFDRLRTAFDTADAQLAGEVRAGHQDLAHTRTVRDWAFAAMLTVFLLTALALALLLQLAVLRPLEQLRRTTRQVVEGEFARPLVISGPRDIRVLGEDVDAMRHRLLAALDRAGRQRAELDQQTEELRRSNAELEQFAYVASHDLQEPLRKVSSFCQLIEKRYGDQLDERGQQYIAYAVDGAKRMQVLINDLLAFSRVGRLHDDRQTVSTEAVLTTAADNLAAALQESGARLERPDTLPLLSGDPTLLTMLWQNLLGNAVKFRSPERSPVVEVAWQPDPDTPGLARFTVSDNGIGIPPEFAEKIFVIFQRLHGRDAYQGTGIGLALCRKIVEHHGGTIRLDPDHGPGARFVFTLPLAAEPAVAPVPEGSRSS